MGNIKHYKISNDPKDCYSKLHKMHEAVDAMAESILEHRHYSETSKGVRSEVRTNLASKAADNSRNSRHKHSASAA